MAVVKEIKCLSCGKLIRGGRSDKKFCNTACKDEYHNSRKGEMNKEIQKIDLALKRNRNTLKRFYDSKKGNFISRDQLLKSGFEFQFHTHYIITKIKGNEFTFCY